MKRIWITGADGHIGSALTKLLDSKKYYLCLTDLSDCDITDIDQVKQFVRINHPDVVVNCAGYTDVQECEANSDMAYKVNAIGVRNIALAANSIHAKVIQMSTDDVFGLDADSPYNEFDDIHPITVYGKSKAAGERMLSQFSDRFVIIRSSWIYGIGRDFVNTVLDAAEKGGTLEVPNNRYASPTSASELARVITHFIEHDEYGIYHVVCPGGCSRYEFAKAILEDSGKKDRLELSPILSDNTNRPAYSVLDNLMLRLSGIEEPLDWRTALKNYMSETGGNE